MKTKVWFTIPIGEAPLPLLTHLVEQIFNTNLQDGIILSSKMDQDFGNDLQASILLAVGR